MMCVRQMYLCAASFGLGADAEATEFVQAELKWLREELSLSNGNGVSQQPALKTLLLLG